MACWHLLAPAGRYVGSHPTGVQGHPRLGPGRTGRRALRHQGSRVLCGVERRRPGVLCQGDPDLGISLGNLHPYDQIISNKIKWLIFGDSRTIASHFSLKALASTKSSYLRLRTVTWSVPLLCLGDLEMGDGSSHSRLQRFGQSWTLIYPLEEMVAWFVPESCAHFDHLLTHNQMFSTSIKIHSGLHYDSGEPQPRIVYASSSSVYGLNTEPWWRCQESRHVKCRTK